MTKARHCQSDSATNRSGTRSAAAGSCASRNARVARLCKTIVLTEVHVQSAPDGWLEKSSFVVEGAVLL